MNILNKATERKIEAQRVLQFCRAVRAGKTTTKLAEVEDGQDYIEQIELFEPDTRLNCSVAEWLKLNGLKARGLNIWTHLDIVSDRSGTYVPILNKQVGSKTFKNAPGMVEVVFPDGRLKLVNFDRQRIDDMLTGLGRLIKSLIMIKTSLIQRGLGFATRLKMLFVVELTKESFELIKRIISTSAYDMKKVTFLVMNHSINDTEEDQAPLEITADAENRDKYETQIQDIFRRLKSQLSQAPTNLRAHAFRRACELVQSDKIPLTMIFNSLPDRAESLFEILRDSDDSVKLDLIRIHSGKTSEIDANFQRQCHETNGIEVEIISKIDDEGHLGLTIKKSSDLNLIERELATASDYSEHLMTIKEQYEQSLIDRTQSAKPEKSTPKTPPKSIRPKSSPDIWIPSRDTLLTIQRKNHEKCERSNTVWYPPSSLGTGRLHFLFKSSERVFLGFLYVLIVQSC